MRGGGMMAKGGTKGGAVMAKGGSVKMAKGGMAKGYNIGGAIEEVKKKKTAKGMAKGGAVKMRGGGMAKGYKAGGVATKGGTKGGVSGGTKVTRADGIAKEVDKRKKSIMAVKKKPKKSREQTYKPIFIRSCKSRSKGLWFDVCRQLMQMLG